MARKASINVRLATRSGVVAFSGAIYRLVEKDLIRCNQVFAMRKGAANSVYDTLRKAALNSPDHFSKAALGWLDVGDIEQAA